MQRFWKLLNQPKRNLLSRLGPRVQAVGRQRRGARIAIITDRVYPYFKGGAEKRYWEIAKHLTELDYEVCFYTGQWPGMPRQSVIDGITLFGIYRVGKFYVKGRKSITESLIYTVKVLQYLLTEEYDLIECEQFPLLPIFTSKIASILRGKPLVVTWHEVWGKDLWIRYLGQSGRIATWIESISIHLADHLISVSQQTTQKLIRTCRVPGSKVSTIPNGIDLRWDRRVSTRTGPQSNGPTASNAADFDSGCHNRRSAAESSDLIYVGRLLNHKNVDLLLRVVAYIRRSRPDITCLIIGDGPERPQLEEMSRRLGIEQSVHFLGSISNDRRVYSLIRSSKVFLLPSVREGFGIAVLEANACGIPAVVIDHKDNAACQLVREGLNGYVCHLDHAEIGERVMQILDAPPQRYRFACHAISQHFSWERVGHRVDEIYQRMLDLKRGLAHDVAIGD